MSTTQPAPAAPAQLALERTLLTLAALLCLNSGLQYLARQYVQLPFPLWLSGSLGPLLGLSWATLALHRRYPEYLAPPPERPGYWAWVVCGIGAGLVGGLLVGGTPLRALAPHFGLPGQLAWGLLWVCIAAPLIEEWFFRGTLQEILGYHVTEGWAVGLAALGFMLIHLGLPFPWIWFGLGVVCGALRNWSGSLGPAVAAHMAWNLGTLALGLAPETQSAVPWAAGVAVLGLIGALVADARGGGPR